MALDLDHTGSVITVPAQSGNGIAISATGPVGYAVGFPNGVTNFRRPASYTNFGNSAIWVAALRRRWRFHPHEPTLFDSQNGRRWQRDRAPRHL